MTRAPVNCVNCAKGCRNVLKNVIDCQINGQGISHKLNFRSDFYLRLQLSTSQMPCLCAALLLILLIFFLVSVVVVEGKLNKRAKKSYMKARTQTHTYHTQASVELTNCFEVLIRLQGKKYLTEKVPTWDHKTWKAVNCFCCCCCYCCSCFFQDYRGKCTQTIVTKKNTGPHFEIE